MSGEYILKSSGEMTIPSDAVLGVLVAIRVCTNSGAQKSCYTEGKYESREHLSSFPQIVRTREAVEKELPTISTTVPSR